MLAGTICISGGTKDHRQLQLSFPPVKAKHWCEWRFRRIGAQKANSAVPFLVSMVCEELDLNCTVALLSHAYSYTPRLPKKLSEASCGGRPWSVHSAQRTRVARPSRHGKEFGGTWTEEQLFDA